MYINIFVTLRNAQIHHKLLVNWQFYKGKTKRLMVWTFNKIEKQRRNVHIHSELLSIELIYERTINNNSEKFLNKLAALEMAKLMICWIVSFLFARNTFINKVGTSGARTHFKGKGIVVTKMLSKHYKTHLLTSDLNNIDCVH